jgi:hypothetical protein
MAIGEEGLGEYAREQLEAARRHPRLERGSGAMIADFWAAMEEADRTRMAAIFGLHELQRGLKREQERFDAEGGDKRAEAELQALWERAELARAEIENDHPAFNAHALIAMNSALDALVEQFVEAVRDLPFLVRMKEAEEKVPEAAKILTPEIREAMLEKLREAFKVSKLKRMGRKGGGTARYEPLLKQVSLDAPEDRPIPDDLDQALAEIGALRDVLIHRAARVDEDALEKASSLRERFVEGQLIRLSGEDFRTYSAAIRCYGAEVIHRFYRRWPDLADPEGGPNLANWRDYHTINA